jgi:hypothetical protein
MSAIAFELWADGFTLRSGHSPGADQAFEAGASELELYLPWKGFGGKFRCPEGIEPILYTEPTDEAYELASKFHPAWDHLSDKVKALHARNCHQVLGRDLQTFSKFVICWTPDGATYQTTSKTGGTGQALRIAIDRRIDIYNLERQEVSKEVYKWLYG